MKNLRNLIEQIIKNKPQSEDEVLVWKRKFAKQNKIKISTNAELLSVYRKMLKKKIVEKSAVLEQLLKKRQIRTLSGVAPIAVLTKPYKCPGKCLYCPSEKDMPKSYLSNEPAVMRADLCDFHPFKQVALRLAALKANGHDTDKLELIVMGGTWDALPERYRLWYVYVCFAAANNPAISIKALKHKSIKAKKNKRLTTNNKQQTTILIDSKIKLKSVSEVTWRDLYREQKKNETAKHRMVGLTLETRPDYVTEKSTWEMRQLGCTRVELGVQHIDDQVLKLNQRGHGVAETIKATRILRDFGFKITYHLMPNLPGSNPAKDLAMFKKIFSDPDFQPDQIKIYPCVVTKDSKLYHWWRQGKYKPYTESQLRKLLTDIKKILPYYVRVIRVIRDIPEESIVAGNKISNLRDLLKVKCRCIRCREVGHQDKTQNTINLPRRQAGKTQGKEKLFIQKYRAGNSMEYFLSYESPDRKVLYAFCRLHLPSTSYKLRITSYKLQIPIIRELHSYGQLVPLGGKIEASSQHKGLGKKLLVEAEKIAKKNNFAELAVIAGIGVREYYKKFGYREFNTYMIKKL